MPDTPAPVCPDCGHDLFIDTNVSKSSTVFVPSKEGYTVEEHLVTVPQVAFCSGCEFAHEF